MNLRGIKKDIEYVLGAFIEDCSIVGTVNEKVDEGSLTGLVEEAVDLFNDLKDRVNARGMKKADFTQIRQDLLIKTDELYEKLSKVVKESVEGPKPEAKKPAAKKPAAKKEAKPEEEKAEKPAAKKAAPKKAAAPKAEKPAAEKKPAAKKAPKKAAEKAE